MYRVQTTRPKICNSKAMAAERREMLTQERYQKDYEDDDHDIYLQPHRRHGKRCRCGGGGAEQSQAPEEEQRQQEPQDLQQPLEEEELSHEDQEPSKQSSEDDSDESGNDTESLDDFISVSRSEIRSHVKCPICLGIINKARVVMGCQHRFCGECIDQSLRMGDHKCPTCRMHFPSRRSLRDDPCFDSLIGAIYPDAEKSEEEELGLHKEERALNEQTPKSSTHTSQRQSEKSTKRLRLGPSQASCSYQHAYSRSKNNNQSIALQQSDHSNSSDYHKQKAPTEEYGTQTKLRSGQRIGGALPNQTSTPLLAINSKGREMENSIRENLDDHHASVTPVYGTFSLGRGGACGHSWHGSASSSRNAHCNQLSKSVNSIENRYQNDDQYNVHIQPSCLDEETTETMAERIVSTVLPEARSRLSELPIEMQENICFHLYRCILPFLEVLYHLEEKEREMQQLSDALRSTVESLKADLYGCQNRLIEMESLRIKLGERTDQVAKVDSLIAALSYVQSELAKVHCEEGKLPRLEEFERLNGENLSLHGQGIALDARIAEARDKGKMWYKSSAEYERDLRDAKAVYYRIGKSAMKKKVCEVILEFNPSFEPTKFNLDPFSDEEGGVGRPARGGRFSECGTSTSRRHGSQP